MPVCGPVLACAVLACAGRWQAWLVGAGWGRVRGLGGRWWAVVAGGGRVWVVLAGRVCYTRVRPRALFILHPMIP